MGIPFNQKAGTYKLMLAIIAVLAFTLASCTNEQPIKVNLATQNMPISNVANEGLNPENSENPYDIYGATHSAIIQNFFESSNYSGTDYAGFVDDYFSIRLEYLQTHNPYNLSIEEYTALNDAYRNSTVFFQHPYIDSLNAIAKSDETLLLYSTGINQYCNAVRNLETAIIADEELDTNTKAEILKRTSIARYSIAFWYEHILNGTLEEYCSKENMNALVDAVRTSSFYNLLVDQYNQNGYSDKDMSRLVYAGVAGGDFASILESLYNTTTDFMWVPNSAIGEGSDFMWVPNGN